jgi:Cu+-exporting ATPase
VIDGVSSGRRVDDHRRADPRREAAGAAVTGGTVNGTERFVMEVKRVGADTLLAQIVAMVGDAQRSRAPIQRLADRRSAVVRPGVVAIARSHVRVWGAFGPEPRPRTRSSTPSRC